MLSRSLSAGISASSFIPPHYGELATPKPL
jgi:hypothetical protein